ncbi:hypothetical protein [Arcticibacter sp. MXS-1]|uniref:hypothetical protein n=1 Tax=Arcticibacter sp. MXS-1 TaxID=3341726 RepID=UPI0035A8C9F2
MKSSRVICRILFIVLPALLLFSCGQNKSNKKENSGGQGFDIGANQSGDDEITCWGIGPVELDNDMQSLAEKVGKENLSQDSLFAEGMFEGFVTTVWKNSPREIIVHWKEKKEPFQNIQFLEIRQASSPYHFLNGVKIGSRASEITRLNGGTPFLLYGFGWDNGGTFVSFNKGKLAGDMPCFGGVFALPDNVDAKDAEGIMGDMEIKSTVPALQKYDARLVALRVKNI